MKSFKSILSLVIISFILGLFIFSIYKINLIESLIQKIKLPETTGQFGIGTTTIHLVDKARKENHNISTNRELVMQVYYPIDKTNNSEKFEKYLAKNSEYVKQNIADLKNIKLDKLTYINNLKTHSIKKAPISNKNHNYPVIIFSPGFGSPQNTYTSYLEEIASHGYIVFGIDHPYVTNPTIFPDGRIIKQDPEFNKPGSENKKDLEFNTWILDIKFLINMLTEINSRNYILNNKLDLEKIGVIGHSFGGRVIIEASRQDNRIKAGIDLDGKLTPNIMLNGFDKPFMFILAQREPNKDQELIEKLQKNITQDAFLVIIEGSDHGTFTDLNLIFKPWFYQGNIDPARGINITREYIINFFDKYLKNKDIDLLKDIIYPEVKISKN